MTYDLAVWEGDRPADDAAAGELFALLYNEYVDTEVEHPPTEAIVRYVEALLDGWSELERGSPWATIPLIDEATGPLIYFPMRWSMAEEASAYAARVATSLGLVCYDPQEDRLRS